MSSAHDDSLIIRTWYEIAVNALHARASDIHIEAGPQDTLVRFRVDGLLNKQARYSVDLHERLITRIKILARLDIAEKRLPQDGRLCIGHDFTKPDVDCRVSIIPTLHGEKAVVRILLNHLEELALEQIGLLPEQLAIFQKALSQPNGLILVTGPTGSGKTRTLYSCLQELNQIHRNLCSIEDPIEIRLPGINQVAYHPRAGLDFPVIIKALLRQDPDVIMIGEIRDGATAQLAIQAAQTGHLVLSTLHTRDARGALARLKNLGIDQEALESTLLSVSSQRLLRKICAQCSQKIPTPPLVNCSMCMGKGYWGRIGVHEVLSAKHLFIPSLPYLSMYEAGLHYVKTGEVNQTSLNNEVSAWH
ncbi:GspE/PulE family protein [Polynucleobacter asymbioticus]|uniref:Type II secretion system protein E n=1 Tax=Polynucleobacter asymbioticus TaxID=576611 RepID=A0AAC9NI51_9BURK|nr:GspE/PulE family protein [Polynucleobacter asymbioticus]APB98043.1 type II secretion system protein E [Polynucleobacter asymbioticus]APC00329.1 type II secretion system protein E [Polynucleobacter asymbioticus]